MLLWINRSLVAVVIGMFVFAVNIFYVYYCKNTLHESHEHFYNVLPVSLNVSFPKNNDEIVEIINNELKIDYVLIFTNFEDMSVQGRATIIFNIVEINENLNQEMFTIVLTHELVHLKYRTCDELFANYQTFLTLYESSNPYLNYCAIILANMIFSHTVYCSTYDCCYYIGNYLTLV